MYDIEESLHEYMQPTGARINVDNCRAIALRSWTKTTPIMIIKYYDDIKILGFNMMANLNETEKKSWAIMTSMFRTHTQNAYHIALNLDNRIRYINEFILATAWYTTQIFPPPTDNVRQMNAATSFFIWMGAILNVPQSTLQLPKEDGGRALIHIMEKCMTYLP
jgi:hypothetical protein